jgi:NAD(P)-dependent dehydrogenase (short-subunit alcohol dehydrogenase family)
VNLASVTGKRPLARRSAYATSKLGVIGLTRTLAVELGPDGIRVNAVSPSGVQGERLDQVIASAAESSGRSADAIREAARRESALGRFVTADEVAATVRFLLSEDASGLTGQDLNVSVGTVMY